MKVLLVLNWQIASTRPFSSVSCYNSNQVISNTVAISKDFDHCFVINDKHKLTDKEFEIMPPHAIEGSIDCELIPNKLQSKYITYLHKNELNAFDSEHNKNIILDSFYTEFHLAGFISNLDIMCTFTYLTLQRKNAYLCHGCTGRLTKDF